MSEIREAINEVVVEGILKEKTMEIVEINTEKGKQTVIRGELIISTGENNEHRVRVFANESTKDKKDNPVFKGLKTVMNEYVSIAEATKNGQTEDAADKVRITKGKFGLNEYYTASGELKNYPMIQTNFVNRCQNGYNPRAEFSIEMYFEALVKEIKDEEETGRLLIKGIVPLYGGKVIPLTFIAEDADTVDYLEQNYETKRTGKVWGEIINTIEIHKEIEKGFGKSKEKITTNVKNELLVTGGDEDQYDEDDKRAYSTSIIKKAMAERDVYLDELLAKSKKEGSKKSSTKTEKSKKTLNF
jgi:hypothetical protein